MKEIKAPSLSKYVGKTSIFLAGSIEMDAAEKWQDKVCNKLNDLDVVLYNPRRDEWDSSWEQKIENPQFKEQVDWELGFIDYCDIVFFYFDPNTKSPISLMELGFCLGKKKAVFVCCPDGFWRKGNVDVICEKSNVTVFKNLGKSVEALRIAITTSEI